MPRITFVGQSIRNAASPATASSRLVNCYREPIGDGGFLLRPVPGLIPFGQLPSVIVRDLETVDGKLYAASAAMLYEISATGAVSSLATIEDGLTTIAGNNGLVTVCANGRYWVWDGAAATEPAAGAFDDFGSLEYFGNYTVLTERNGRRFQWSDIADATDLPGLNFSTADGKDDNLIRPFVINGQLFLWKERSHEIWYLTGGAGADAFERAAGGVGDIGLKAHGLIARIPGGAFLIGDDNRAHLASNGLQPVSTPAVEDAIQNGGPQACVVYEVQGHTFCAIVFADRPAWVFDLATAEWHERAQGGGPWSVSATAKFRGDWYAGRSDGAVFAFGGITDDGFPVVKQAVTQTLAGDARLIVREMELFARKGIVPGQITLEMSRDNGVTFGPAKAREIGPVGDTDKRIVWRNLGQFRQATARIAWDGDLSIRADGMVMT